MLYHDQTVYDMANEVLARQASASAEQTGESFDEALAAVLKTEAGKKLQNLREGPHRSESAEHWQELVARERARKQSAEA